MPFKPGGYTTAWPYLLVEGAGRMSEFLIAFDAVELRRFTHDDGRVTHAEVRVGASQDVGLGRASAAPSCAPGCA